MEKLKWILTAALICFLPSTLIADEFLSYPGTRAKGMGGAYTAISSEVSSIWYNPAGLAMETEEDKKSVWSILAEYSQGVGMDEEDDDDYDLGADEHKGFIGFAHSNGKWGWGMAWYSPYSVNGLFRTYDNAGDPERIYKLSEDMHIVSLGGAYTFLNRKLKIGGTLEYVYLDLENSKVYNYNTGNYTTTGDDNNEYGVSGSIGVLWDVISQQQFDNMGLKLTLGYTHRFDSATDSQGYDHGGDVEASSFEKPGSDNLGIAFSFPISFLTTDQGTSHNLTLAYDYSQTYWSDANEAFDNDYEKNAFGLEWVISFPEARISNLSLRTGYYTSDATEEDEGWADVSGVTVGAGIKFSKWAIEVAYEKRDYEYPDGRDDEDFDLFSFSLVKDF